MKFTFEDAVQASRDGEPIMLGSRDVRRILRNHSIDFEELIDSLLLPIDAKTLLEWVGY